jgi:Tol biopolymer transport system component
MPEIGQTISHYRIIEKLGQGGMGEVFLAHDTSLDRKVALKFLPDIFSGDPERLARFEREAKLLASLNHHNIATIYGLEQAEGKRFLAMELVEGATLAQQIERGPLPVDDALEVCRQIAEGLEAAHEKGIIHRDLKPANVKITQVGKVKILDFGLAKAFQGEAPATDASKSPTLTDQMTQAGVILGTAAYMAPEQAKAKAVDKRADIWAFGCILYECLTGKRPFEGDTVTETLASILTREPDWQALPPFTALKVRNLLHRCLEKDPRRRWHDIADARIEMDDVISAPPGAVERQPGARRRRPLAVGMIAGAAIIGSMILGALLWNYFREARISPPAPMQFAITVTPASEYIQAYWNQPVVAISPDGSRLAYVAARDGITQLFLQEVGRLEVAPVAGTQGARNPFFSPGGAWVGFFTEGKLRKLSIADGSLKDICESLERGAGGAIWRTDNTILFSSGYRAGISQVSADGGTPQPVIAPNPDLKEVGFRWPQILPDEWIMLFTVRVRSRVSYDDAQIVTQRLGAAERRPVIPAAGNAAFVPTGHLVYARAGELFAVPFDSNALKPTGQPKSVLKGIITHPDSGSPQYEFSRTGSLVYVPGSSLRSDTKNLVWLDRNGSPMTGMPRVDNYAELAATADGQRIVVRIGTGNEGIYLFEPARDSLDRLTDEEGDAICPVLTPKGDRVAYSLQVGRASNIFWMAVDKSSPPECLLKSDRTQYPGSFSPGADSLAFTEVDPRTRSDIWILPIRKERKPWLFLGTAADEAQPKISPDGKWLAYVSGKSGRNEVYIQPFPNRGSQQKVSSDGGDFPVWARDGKVLFYRIGNKMMAVAIDAQSGKPGASQMVFERDYKQGRSFAWYDVAGDGRFLVIGESQPQVRLTQINIILNWFEDLKRQVPIK